MRALQEIVSKVFDVPVEKVLAICIHMMEAKEREAAIVNLQQATQTQLAIFKATDGKEAVAKGHPVVCGLEKGKVRTAGEVGCLLSHIEVIQQAYLAGLEYIIVFEDDCQVGREFTPINFFGWLNSVKTFFEAFSWPGSRDLILLATGGTYDQIPLTQFFKGTKRFNCTHAYLMGRGMMKKVIETHEFILKKGQIVPIDGLLGLILQADKKYAVTPTVDDAFFKQDRSLKSYVLNDNREELRQG